MNKWILLSGLCALLLGTPATALPTLMVANTDGLRPIALYEANKFLEPMQAPDKQVILGDLIRSQSPELPLFYNGQEATRFRIGGFEATSAQCKGAGVWSGQSNQPIDRPMLAFSPDFPGPRNYIGTYPTEKFDALAKQLSSKVYLNHKVSKEQLKQLQIRRIEPFTLLNGARVMVAVESEIQSKRRDCPEHHLLLLIEKVGRRYLTVLEKFSNNSKSCTRFQFLSTFATSSTVDKLALYGSNANAHWYDLYQAQYLGGLKPVFHGGGHSCP